MDRMPGESIKKKILFVITKSNFGGAQKYVFDLATSLPKDEFDVTVALGGSGILTDKLSSQNIKVLSLKSLVRDPHLLSDIRAFLELWAIIKKIKPDITHINSAKAGVIGTLTSRFAGVPKIIFTAHGWAFNEERPLYHKVIIRFFSWITVLLSHQTIAVSLAVKNDAKDWPLISEKITVIKNGINVPKFLTRDEARLRLFPREKFRLQEKAFIVGTIAELHKNKGLSYAVTAFKKIVHDDSSVHYFIIGDGEERANLEALIKQSGLEDNVHLLGNVLDAALYLRALDIFLLPSVKEGLPYVVLEAGCASLPVVATNIGGLPEIIEHGVSGILIPPRDASAVENAVQQLRRDENNAKLLGEALNKKILQDFSFEQFISGTLQVYKK